MAIGLNSVGPSGQDVPLDVTAAMPLQAVITAEEAHAIVERGKRYMAECDEIDAKKKAARGNAETIDLPKLADVEVLRRQTRNTLNNQD